MTKHGKPLSFSRRMVKRMPSRKGCVKELDRVFSLWIRLRDGYKCYCGKPATQCGHLISRTNYATRWSEENCSACCSGCNLEHEYHPEKFTQWWIKKYGTNAYDALILKSHTTLKISTGELITLARYYTDKLKEVKDEL